MWEICNFRNFWEILLTKSLFDYTNSIACGKKCVEFNTFDVILFMYKTVALEFTLWDF